jgi:hypothetical protein
MAQIYFGYNQGYGPSTNNPLVSVLDHLRHPFENSTIPDDANFNAEV